MSNWSEVRRLSELVPGIVERHVGRAAHAALAGVVDPGAAVLDRLVQRLLHQQHFTGEARGRHGLLDEVRDDVVEVLRLRARQAVGHHGLVAELDHGVVAARGHRRLADVAHDHVAAITQHVVPEHLDARLRDRERNAFTRLDHAVAARRRARAVVAMRLVAS